MFTIGTYFQLEKNASSDKKIKLKNTYQCKINTLHKSNYNTKIKM